MESEDNPLMIIDVDIHPCEKFITTEEFLAAKYND